MFHKINNKKFIIKNIEHKKIKFIGNYKKQSIDKLDNYSRLLSIVNSQEGNRKSRPTHQ